MKDFLDKISSYNLFNNLLPGVIFAAISSEITQYSFIQADIITGLFVYYFMGLVISRFGSLVIEPLLKWSSFIKFSPYSDFLRVSKQDEKLNTLLEVNNTYRTICSLSILLLLLKFYEVIQAWINIPQIANQILLLLSLLIMFLYSYRKQTSYIRKRVEIGLKEEN